MNRIAPGDPPSPVKDSPSVTESREKEKKVAAALGSAKPEVENPSSNSTYNRDDGAQPVLRRRVSAVRIEVNDEGKSWAQILRLLLHDKGMILFKAFVFVLVIQFIQTLMMVASLSTASSSNTSMY